ncbi:MAG: zinc-ribbon domain-containing protein [Lachnospiraceae bacterium]
MKCNKCGKEIDDAAKFCPYCGEKITVPDIEETVKEDKLEEKTEKKSEKKSEKNFEKKPMRTGIIVAVIALIMVIGAGIGFGIWSTGAKAYINKYAKTIKSRKWESAYQYMNMENTDLSEEDYVKWADAYLSGIEDYTIEKISDDENQEEYEISFTNDKGKEVFRNTYILEKQDEKRAVFFPAWKIVKNAFIVECVEFCVPEGAEVLLDEVKLEDQPADENGMVTYQIPVMFVGPHSIKVTKEFYEDYEDVTFINADALKDGTIVLDLVLSDEIVKDVCFSVPSGAEFYLDDVKVEDTYLTDEGNSGKDTYRIPFLEQGDHKVKVVKKYYNDYEETIQIESDSVAMEPIIIEPVMIETEAWRFAYQDFLNAVMNRDMDAIAQKFSESEKDVAGFFEAYDYHRDVLDYEGEISFSLVQLNDDEIPELLLEDGLAGMVFTYVEGKIKAVSVASSLFDSDAFLGGERDSYYLIAGEGLILLGGVSNAGAVQFLYVFQFNGNATTSQVNYICSDIQSPEYSEMNGETVTPEEAENKMNEYLNRATDIESKAITVENIVADLEM